MSIKITVLKSGEQIISDMKELMTEGEENAQAYMLVNPHTYEITEKQFITEEEKNLEDGDYGINVSLLPWLILSKDKKMIIPTDSVLTVVEPLESVTQLYLDKVGSFDMEKIDD
tara:strand:- start:170 stop:511 length:342 start_codon:yes stop_codon:yes gene_type:complete